MKKMQTTISKRGQTVVPSTIRKNHHLQEGGRLVWLDDGETIKVIPIPGDSVGALKGIARGERLMEELMKYRRAERARER
jgi:AbrB family looped-hinge helix DNA binding protein